MLVEDDNSLREIYQARLSAEGYETVSAKDGEEALALVGKEKPDLIILDVMMPKISGFDTLDILRSTPATRDTKIIMMSALSQAEDKLRAEKLGANRYLVKSQVTLEDIVKNVKEVLANDETPSATGMPQAAPAFSTVPTPLPSFSEVSAPAATPQPEVATEGPAAPVLTPEPDAAAQPIAMSDTAVSPVQDIPADSPPAPPAAAYEPAASPVSGSTWDVSPPATPVPADDSLAASSDASTDLPADNTPSFTPTPPLASNTPTDFSSAATINPPDDSADPMTTTPDTTDTAVAVEDDSAGVASDPSPLDGSAGSTMPAADAALGQVDETALPAMPSMDPVRDASAVPETPAPATDFVPNSDTPNIVAEGGDKVIAPPTADQSTASKPDFNDLLAQEQAKENAHPQTPPTDNLQF